MKKKALIASIMSLIMSISVICGATYALFTNESIVNIAVTSGNVNVTASAEIVATYSAIGKDVMSYTDADKNSGNTFENGGNVEFANSGLLNINKMTPGDRVDIKVTLTNNSDVNIRYRTAVEDTTTDAMKKNGVSLFDALIVDIDGSKLANIKSTAWSDVVEPNGNAAIKEINMVIAFPDGGTNGEDNKYQGLECALAIKVEAVQANGALPVAVVENYTESEIPTLNTFNKPVKLDDAFKFSAQDNAETVKDSPYAKWGVDYLVSFNKKVKANSAGLAGHFDAYTNATGTEWVAFLAPIDVSANEEVYLVNAVTGMVLGSPLRGTYEMLIELVGEFDCGVFNLSEENVGTVMTVKLVLFECDEETLEPIPGGKQEVVSRIDYTFKSPQEENLKAFE